MDWDSTVARGSKPVLLYKRSETSARRRADTPVTLTEGCVVTTGSMGSVRTACSITAVEVQEGGACGHAKTKRSLQTLQTTLKTCLERAALEHQGFCPVATSEAVGGVVKLDKSSAIGNRPECLTFMRGNAESSAKKGLRVPAPPFPAPQINRCRMVRTRRAGCVGVRRGATPSRRVIVAQWL